MSAVNILVQRDAVHILSDGAVYDDHAVFKHAAPKVVALPNLNCAIALRGPAIAPPLVANIFSGGASNYDDLKHRIFDLLKEAIGAVQHVTRSAFGSNAQLFVAGWSEGRPDAYSVLTRPTDGLPAWTPIPIPEHIFSPFETNGPVHADFWEIFGERPVRDLDPRTDGIRIIEAQRRHKSRLPDGRRAYIVGGFAQLTSVRSEAITTEVLRRWPDKAGERINPKE